jgi:DNA repair ATPase RecN
MDVTFAYREFVESIHQARSLAARFVRVDLHTHTIDSPDFPSTHEKPGFVSSIPPSEHGYRKDLDAFAAAFKAQAKARSLRLLAVTDHNQSTLGAQLSLASEPDLAILPGIEISVQTSLFPDSQVHILAIFPLGTPTIEIDKVFPPGCGMPEPAKRELGSCTTQSIPDLLSNIRALRGIAIAAHASGSKGIRASVHSQYVKWLEKNYLRRYLKERREKGIATPEEEALIANLDASLKPLDDEVQNAYLHFLSEHHFDAIQIMDVEHHKYYSGEHVTAINLPPFSCILASDAHTVADLGCPGHATHIKVSSLDLAGLKKAFLDPEARIRYDQTVPTHRPRRILGLSLEGGSFSGHVIGFSDNLTTLIGGRGTGKSAIVEAIRYALAIPIPELPDKLVTDIQDRLEFTLRETELKLLYQDEEEGQPIIIKRRLGESRPTCYLEDGTPLPEITLPGSSRVRAEVYGWSEIEELSDSPRKQLALLDRTIPTIDSLRPARTEAIEALRVNAEAILSNVRTINELIPKLADAQEIKGELQRLSTPELDQAFSEFDANLASASALGSLRNSLAAIYDSFLGTDESRDLAEEINTALADATPSLQTLSFFPELSESLQKTALSSQEAYMSLLAGLRVAIDNIDQRLVFVTEARRGIEARLNALAETSGQPDFKAAMSRRKELSDRLTTIAVTESAVESASRSMKSLLQERSEKLFPQLARARHSLFDARISKASEIGRLLNAIPAAGGIDVKLVETGDRTEFIARLGRKEGTRYEGLLKGIDHHYMSKNYPGYFAAKFTPEEFVSLLLNPITAADPLGVSYIRRRGDPGAISHIPLHDVLEDDDALIEQGEDDATIGEWPMSDFEHVTGASHEAIWRHLSPYWDGTSQVPYPVPEKLAHLFDLEVIELEDAPQITLSGISIEHLSPGQRCSALIPIILAEGHNPLVIDQPEDNLDNKLVFDLVVDVLRDLKEQRQIILATHNPNIPVSGDAEQVVVFDAPSRSECVIVAQASIDSDEIVSHIKAVMEGGDKAFEMRMKKYGFLG